jgi:hypothetical protein
MEGRASTDSHGGQPLADEGNPTDCPTYYVKYIETKGACYDSWVVVKKEGESATAENAKAVKDKRCKAEGSRRIGDEADLGNGVATCVVS